MNEIMNFYNVVELKRNLIVFSEKNLVKLYNNEQEYINFLDGLLILLTKEEAFLTLSPRFLDKIKTIISEKRFEITSNDLVKKINEILIQINIFETIPEYLKQYKAWNYVAYQNSIRHIYYDNFDDFLGAMSMDYDVLKALLQSNIENFTDDEIFLSATNYFMAVIPELYENEKVSNITKKKLKELKSKKYHFREKYIKTYARQTDNAFKNIYK